MKFSASPAAWRRLYCLAFNYRSMSWNGGALNLAFKLGVQMTGAMFELEESDWTVADRKEWVRADTISASR